MVQFSANFICVDIVPHSVSDKMAEEDAQKVESSGFLANIIEEIITSPLNISLVFLIAFLVFKILKNRGDTVPDIRVAPPMPKMKKKDFTVEELKAYDGTQPDGRVLVAVNGNVYDVTKGKKFYGPGKRTCVTNEQS